ERVDGRCPAIARRPGHHRTGLRSPRKQLQDAVLLFLRQVLEVRGGLFSRQRVELTDALTIGVLHLGDTRAPGIGVPLAHLEESAAIAGCKDVLDPAQVVVDEADDGRFARAWIVMGGDYPRTGGLD